MTLLRGTTLLRGKTWLALLVGTALATQTVIAPAPAEARGGGGLVAAGIGGLVLGMIAGGALAQQRPRYARPVYVRARPRGPVISSATVAVQNALTYYGFYAGPINGQMDKPTRDGIKAFQAKVGQPPTGTLTAEQRRGLLTVYAQRGSTQTVAQTSEPNPDNIFAVIAGGGATGAAAGGGGTSGGNGLMSSVDGDWKKGGGSADGGNAIGGSASGGVAPSPVRAVPALGSDVYRDRCQSGEPQPGGAASALVPGQICQARVAALFTAKEAFSAMTGVEPAAVRTECGRIAESLTGLRSVLAAETPQAVIKRAAREFASVTADQKASAASNFQICLGFGFVDNSPEVVLSSALALIGIGEGGYGEIIGGAFALGAGVDANRAKAAAWLDQAAAAIDAGATPVIKDRGIERAEILRLTAAELKSNGPGKPQLVIAGLSPREPGSVPREAERSNVPVFGGTSGSSPAQPETAAASRLATTKVEPVATVRPVAATAPTTPTLGLATTAAVATAPSPAPVVALPAAPPTSPEGRRAAAESFFASEQAEQRTRLAGLASVLGLDSAALAPICTSQAAALSPPKAEAMVNIRLCRADAYARGDRAAMYRFDRALSDLGDADAEGRLTRHLLLGNDRAQEAAAQ